LHDEHAILWTANKCLDFRRFASAPGHDEQDSEDIKEPLKHIIQWITKWGVPHVLDIDDVYAQAKLLADNMKIDIDDFYNACARPEQACHRWHCNAEDGTYANRYGTLIKKDIRTLPRLSSQRPSFLWVYNDCMLKTANEAVVEGMCKFISKQADSFRGLSFKSYGIYVLQMFPFPLSPSLT